MKKLFTLFAAVALTASAAMASVITLDLNKPLNPTSLEYNEYGIWTGCYDDVNYTWLEFGDENGEFALSHLIDGEGASWGGYYWDGFCPAIGGDQTDYNGAWTTTYGGCMAGGGCVINNDGSVTADPAQPYLVAYYSSWAMEGPSNQVMFMNKDGNTTFTPVGVYVCNHPWPYYGCVHGDGFGRAFEDGDYFELVAHGVDADENEKTVSINLVEFTDGELKALNDWTFFDLSSLGEVESVYFTLNSTDVGDYGMNTAAYFCMDKFMVEDGNTDGYENFYLVGTFNSWSQEDGMVAFVGNEEGTEYTATIELEADAEFKVIVPDGDGWKWFGGQDDNNVGYFLINDEISEIALVDGANFKVAEAGNFTFTIKEAAKAVNEPLIMTVTKNDPQAITTIATDKQDNTWYNLQGQKFNGMPSVPGIYINNGKKVLVK